MGQDTGTYSVLPNNAKPEFCGSCHSKQWEDWQTSMHKKSLSPAVIGQFSLLGHGEEKCLSCHAPLTKAPLDEKRWEQNSGMVCADCHLRSDTIWGPEEPKSRFANISPHKIKTQSVYSESVFCKRCHESPETGQLLAGKKMMEVFSEWELSKSSRSCQSCHMPNRDHTWKGIHDKDYVKSAIKIDFFWKDKSSYKSRVVLNPSGVGHFFPSYLIPKIYLKVYLITADNKKEKRQLEEYTIGRQVNTEITEEYFDTRIPPNQSLVWDVQIPEEYQTLAAELELIVEVDPDEQYIRELKEKIKSEKLLKESKKLLQFALEEKLKSKYILANEILRVQ